MKEFKLPNFETRSLELRIENGDVCIYGTQNGLRKLSQLCLELADTDVNSSSEHIHLEDYDILSPESLPGVVGVFRQNS